MLSEPLLLRGKSKWSQKLLEKWWGFYADGFGGAEREALLESMRTQNGGRAAQSADSIGLLQALVRHLPCFSARQFILLSCVL